MSALRVGLFLSVHVLTRPRLPPSHSVPRVIALLNGKSSPSAALCSSSHFLPAASLHPSSLPSALLAFNTCRSYEGISGLGGMRHKRRGPVRESGMIDGTRWLA